METWSQDNIVVVGDLSYDYWLVVEDDSGTNVTFSYAVSDGVLNINSSRTGTISEVKYFRIQRKIDLTNVSSAIFEVRVKLNQTDDTYTQFSIQTQNLNYLVLLFKKNTFKLYYYNGSGQYDSVELMSSVTFDEWHTVKAEIDNRTINIYFDGSIKAQLTTSKDLKDFDIVEIHHHFGSLSTLNYPNQIYIDYIGFKTQFYDPALTNAFMQLAITLAMLGVALSFVKRAIR